eukprot:1149403-Pelagomonas_calceolata.AAC.4
MDGCTSGSFAIPSEPSRADLLPSPLSQAMHQRQIPLLRDAGPVSPEVKPYIPRKNATFYLALNLSEAAVMVHFVSTENYTAQKGGVHSQQAIACLTSVPARQAQQRGVVCLNWRGPIRDACYVFCYYTGEALYATRVMFKILYWRGPIRDTCYVFSYYTGEALYATRAMLSYYRLVSVASWLLCSPASWNAKLRHAYAEDGCGQPAEQNCKR